MSAHFDLAIVGAGLAGSTLAAALANQAASGAGEPWHVALIDPAKKPGMVTAGPPTLDNLALRVSSINAGVANALRRLAVWQRLPRARVTPFGRLSVTEGAAELTLDAATIGEGVLGYLLENPVLLGALAASLDQRREVTRFPTPLRAMQLEAPGEPRSRWRLQLGNGDTLTCRLLVAADGGDSLVRQLAGITTRRIDFRQSAVAGNLVTCAAHGNVARQRFLASGPLALLPLPGRYRAMVWSTSPDRAERLAALDAENFARELQHAWQDELPALQVGPRVALALQACRVDSYVGERLALLGDAAHQVHPLGGLGANLGMLGALTLAELLLPQRANPQRDPGNAGLLQRYNRWQRSQALPVEQSLLALQRLFLGNAAWRRLPRRCGLTLASRAPWPRGALIREACALHASAPLLCRPLPDNW